MKQLDEARRLADQMKAEGYDPELLERLRAELASMIPSLEIHPPLVKAAIERLDKLHDDDTANIIRALYAENRVLHDTAAPKQEVIRRAPAKKPAAKKRTPKP